MSDRGELALNQHIFAFSAIWQRSAAYLHTLLRYLVLSLPVLAAHKQTTGLGHVTKRKLCQTATVLSQHPR